MKYRLLCGLFLLIIFVSAISCRTNSGDSLSVFEKRADSIIKLMTLEEKIGQVSLFTSDMSQTGPTMRDDYTDLIK